MDFATLDTSKLAEEGAVLNVRHPVTGEDTGAWIRVCGTDSQRFRDLVKRRAREQMNRKQKTLDIAGAEQRAIETLAACTLDWGGIAENGDELPLTYENAQHMYGKYLWLREQVDEFMADRGHFLPSA